MTTDSLSLLAASLPGLWRASAWLRATFVAAGHDGVTVTPAALAFAHDLAEAAWTPKRLMDDYQASLALAPAADPEVARRSGALRRLRRRLLAGLILRDGSGLADLSEVTGAMSALARLAVTELLAAIVPAVRAQWREADGADLPDLIVLAMGKAGADELNVSSDLDLIFCYDLPEPAAAQSSSAQTYCDRIGQRLIHALGNVDAAGFIFRVDMRLRPHGDSGPLTVSLDMLEEYLVREGREWERFAWAKAAVISQPVASPATQFTRAVAQLDSMVRAFVYRRYLDLGAVDAIGALHRRILAQAGHRGLGRHARDIKLGRGGIREIEFFAQTFSIMRGGRDPRLRVRGTQACLDVLAAADWLPRADADTLLAHYRFLRRLEHALQYRNDEQTHAFADDPVTQEQVATLMRLDVGALVSQLETVTESVARYFDGLLAQTGARSADQTLDSGALPATLWQRAGFDDPEAILGKITRWQQGARWIAAGEATQQRLNRLLAHWLELRAADTVAMAGRPAVEVALLRWMDFMDVIARRGSYLDLLLRYPAAHARVAALLDSGDWPSRYLTSHPILLDELIDPRPDSFETTSLDDLPAYPGAAEPRWQPWRAMVSEQLSSWKGDVERQMNVLRDAHHAQVFRLLLADLDGRVSLEHLADHLCALADAVIGLAMTGAWQALSPEGTEPVPALAVVAFGKLGGRELGYASDLDLAFVYDDARPGEDADRVARRCTQWVQRLVSWLTARTSSGTLFEIDLRLRPNGDAGLLVVPMSAFERYHRNADGRGAWLWETQALTRARICAGDAALGQRFDALRAQVLRAPRPPEQLLDEIAAMRRKMHEAHGHGGSGFDLKHDAGGMIDLEFSVQALILRHAAGFPELLDNLGNIALLKRFGQLGLVPVPVAEAAIGAYRRFRRDQHASRLNGATRTLLAPEEALDDQRATRALWRVVFGDRLA